MCFTGVGGGGGGGIKARKEKLVAEVTEASKQKKLKDFIEANGGIRSFGFDGSPGSRSSAEARAKEQLITSGAFTDRAQIPGAPAPAPVFSGPRSNDKRTGTSDLKFLPTIPTRQR